MKISLNIKSRLTLWYLFVTAILIVLFSIAAYFLLERNLHSNTPHLWDIYVAQIELPADGSTMITGFTEISQSIGIDQSHGFVDVNRYSQKDLIELFAETDYVDIDGVSVDESIIGTLGLEEDEEVWFYTYLDGDTFEVSGVVVVTQSISEVALTLGTFRQVLVIIIPIALVLAGIFGYLLAKRYLRPIQVMASTVREIEEHNLDKRLEVHSSDELGYLASTFNRMLKRLEDAFHREKQFTADASHELRTPLSVIQGEATLALSKDRSVDEYRKSIEDIYQETERMSSILKRLLFLARHEGSKKPEFETINLTELLDELISDMEILCEDKSISCQLHATDDVLVKGDRVILRELFYNLIENAIRYTPKGGEISINLSTRDGEACVAVIDNGIGIPEEHFEHIFKRFYRVDKSRSRSEGGAGLGLSICQRIVEIHGGAIEVESKVGKGSTFIVLLPLCK